MVINILTNSLDHASLIGLVLALCAFFWAQKKRHFRRLPPGPRGVPLLGYLPFLGPDLHREFADMAGRYGPIFKMWLGNKLCVVISSPEMAEEVLREQDMVFANRDSTVAGNIMSYGGNDIALASYGPGWKKLRKIFVREMLNNSILDALYVLRLEEVRKSVREIHGRVGEAVDMGQVAFLTAMNAVLRMSCSSSVEDAAAFKKSAEEMVRLLVTPNVSDLVPSLARFDLQGIAGETRKVNRVFEEMFDEAIRDRKSFVTSKENDTSSRKDFLQFLVDLNQQQHSSIPISDDELKAMITDTVFGATDTTSTTVEWAMTELLNCPEAMEKVCEELASVVGLDNIVQESDLSKLTYLNAVIKEILRLHPPLPFLLPRFPVKSTTVAGYDVPQGTKIIVNAWAIHRDPKSWESPCEFRPERFLSGDASSLRFNSSSNFNYIPFGSGRRICPGLPLAERFTVHILASFLHMFQWKLPDGASLDASEKFGSVLKKRHTLIAIPTARLSNPHLYA